MGARKISRKMIDSAVSSLKQLPAKERESFALREAVYEMRRELEALLKKGYSFEELAELLSGHEIKIKPVTLKQYLTSFKRKTKKKSDVEVEGKDSTVQDSQSGQSGQSGQLSQSRQGKGTGKGNQSEGMSQADKGVDDGFVDMPDDL